MQNVATGKSELAALPLTFNPDSSAVIDNSSEFRSFLQDASDQAFTQPVEPKLPKTIGDNKLSNAISTNETNPAKTEIEAIGTEERPAVAAQQADIAQPEDGSFVQIIDFTGLVELKVEQDITMPLANIASKNSLVVVDDMVNSNTDLVAEMDSIVPSIDLLDLLEQSQFTEITISQGQKATIEDQVKNIQALVEHLKTFSEQSETKADASIHTNSEAVNTVINKFNAVLEQQTIEPESSTELTELFDKIQSEIELKDNPEILPAADIELLSIMFAEESVITETSDIVEGIVVNAQQQNVNFVADSSVKDVVQSPIKPEPKSESIIQAATVPETSTESEPLIVFEAKSLIESESESLLDPEFESAVAISDKVANLEVKTQPDQMIVLNQHAEPKNIKQLLTLSPEKLNKVLDNLANRLIEMDSTSSKDIEIQTKIASTAKHEFIASLKAGFEEIKSQIKQGKQIDSDLKSIVVDSLKQVSQEINHESVSATISRITQTLELSSALMAHVSTNSTLGLETAVGAGAIDRALTKENQSQSDLLQVKQAKQQVVQFEKAVNIVRSEGQNQLVEKVRWMVNQNNLQADIRLDPPDLGAMKVRVSLSGEIASVNIVVQSQQAKDLLDSAAPRLRDLLQEQGIQLGQSSVEQDQRQRDPNGTSVAANNSELSSDAEAEAGHQVTEQTIINGQLSGIDYFV